MRNSLVPKIKFAGKVLISFLGAELCPGQNEVRLCTQQWCSLEANLFICKFVWSQMITFSLFLAILIEQMEGWKEVKFQLKFGRYFFIYHSVTTFSNDFSPLF